MHTHKGPWGTIFHHSNYSGKVIIAFSDRVGVEVPFEDLQSLVAAKIRQEKISRIEDASDEEVLSG